MTSADWGFILVVFGIIVSIYSGIAILLSLRKERRGDG